MRLELYVIDLYQGFRSKLKLFVFYRFGLYRGMWRYTGLKDLENIIKASLVSTSAVIVIILMATRFHGFPRSVFLIDCILTIFLIGGFRMGIRMALQYSRQGALPWQRNGDEIRKKKKSRYAGLSICAGRPGLPARPFREWVS